MCNGPTAAERNKAIEKLVEIQNNMDFAAMAVFYPLVDVQFSSQEIVEKREQLLPLYHPLSYRNGMYR